jgi:hypothetical protein
LAKVFTDLDLKEGTHRVSDMLEYMGEALEKIGAFPQFENKVLGKEDLPLLEISNYQAILPSDLHKVIQIAYAPDQTGGFYPMRRASGSFDWSSPSTITASDVENVAATSSIVTLAMTLYDLSYADALAKINNEPETASILSGLLSSQNPVPTPGGAVIDTYDYTYSITNNYIKTNVETGYLMVSYQAIPTDADGYPMIPDLASFHEALYWYINMKLMYPEWKQGLVRDAVYYDARRSWNYYCKQAYGDALMPDRDEIEAVKNTWVRLVPSINEHSNFYNTMAQQEVVYNAHAN